MIEGEASEGRGAAGFGVVLRRRLPLTLTLTPISHILLWRLVVRCLLL